MDTNALDQLKGVLKDGFSRSIQQHQDERDLHLWNYVTSRSACGRILYTVKIALHELRRHFLLTHGDFEYRLSQQHSDHVIYQANRQRLRERRLHMSVLTVPDIIRNARQMARSFNAWEDAKQKNDFSLVKAPFEELLASMRDIAGRKMKLLGLSSPYEALIDEQTPGLRIEKIERYVGDLEKFCSESLPQARYHQNQHFRAVPAEAWRMDVETQKKLARRILESLGFDFSRGRMGEGEHPMCIGTRDDVRIVMNYDEGDFIKSVLDILHEGGHALYRQNLPRMWHWHPVGNIPSQGIDESMALIVENCIGRSPDFAAFLYRILVEEFGLSPAFDQEQLYQRLISIEPTPIRAYADELRYPLDLVLRYRLSQDLFEGKLKSEDMPQRWRTMMKDMAGIEVTDDREGCLQDVHVYSGQIGYFMNYLVGLLAANQLYAHCRGQVSTLHESVRDGNFVPFVAWLRQNVYDHGARFSTFEVIEKITGMPLTPQAYIENMTMRYLVTARVPASRRR